METFTIFFYVFADNRAIRYHCTFINNSAGNATIFAYVHFWQDNTVFNKRITFPVDVIAAKSMDDIKSIKEYKIDKIPNTMSGFDIGSATIEKFSKLLMDSKTIVWNGPMGVFENQSFNNGTLKIAEVMANATEEGSIVIVGGGDTAAAVKSYNLIDKMSHVSTGGGASLELLSGNRLPSVEALGG